MPLLLLLLRIILLLVPYQVTQVAWSRARQVGSACYHPSLLLATTDYYYLYTAATTTTTNILLLGAIPGDPSCVVTPGQVRVSPHFNPSLLLLLLLLLLIYCCCCCYY